jgi:hypothetical protein
MDQTTRWITKIPLLNSASPFWRTLVLLLFACACFAFSGAVQANVIEDENLHPGTTAWELTNPASNHEIEGYASLTSVPVGGDIDFFVNTQDASYALTVYRMGWYGGKGGRLMFGPQTLTGVQQVIPTGDPTVECQWTNPFTLHVANSWVSGIYLVKLHGNSSGKESYIIFCVRDSRQADLVFQQSVTTYQAYNGWPSAHSLYDADSAQHILYDRVSFNRPYAAGDPPQGAGAGDFLGMGAPVAIEYSMVRWLERKAYDVTYITNVDTHEDVGRLLRGKGFLSVGHDEYWSYDMKAHVIQARDQGVGLGFFSANYVFWPIDLEPSSSGVPNRTVSVALDNRCADPDRQNQTTTVCAGDSDCSNGQVCFKKACNFTCLKDASGVSQTEQTLVGGMWDPGHLIDHRYGGDIVVTSDALLNHWVFANTGLQVGDVLPGLIGVEWDATVDDSHYPKPPGLQVLLHTQVPHFAWPNAPDGPNPSGGWPLLSSFDGKDFDGWYKSWAAVRDADPPGQLDLVCHHDKIGPYGIAPTAPFCSNPWPDWQDVRFDWAMTIYQASSGAWVFNAATMEWGWGLDDYFTGLTTADGANNGPPVRTQCGYAWFHPNLVSCRNDAVAQITRNVLSKFQAPDSTAPESELTIGTPQYAASGGQLFVAGATPFTLTATDDSSGVWNVWYRFFPSGTLNPPSYTFVEGFSANFTLAGADGSYEIDSYATDNAANDETPAHVQSVYLDTTAPMTTINAPVAKQYLHSDSFTINYAISDGMGSGVQSDVPDIDGQTTLHDGTTTVTVANGLPVKLLTELVLGTHTFNVNAVDNVDNDSTTTVTFSIIVTAQSIKDEVKYFRSIGAITQDEATALLQKLNAAAAYRARHDCKNANTTYRNFINELRAQTGKKVTFQAASILIADAQYLIVHCP